MLNTKSVGKLSTDTAVKIGKKIPLTSYKIYLTPQTCPGIVAIPTKTFSVSCTCLGLSLQISREEEPRTPLGAYSQKHNTRLQNMPR